MQNTISYKLALSINTQVFATMTSYLWFSDYLNPIQPNRQRVDNNDNVPKFCWNNPPSVVPVMF